MHRVLTDILKLSAKRFPNKKAFAHKDDAITFQELYRKSVQLANLLNGLGIDKGDRVGIYINREIETTIAIYGILLVGGIFVPLDTRAPSDITNFILEDCGIDIVITNKNQNRKIAAIIDSYPTLKAVIGVKNPASNGIIWEEVWEQPDKPIFNISLNSNDPAYILFTSGSTGSPKGILHTHFSGLSYAELTADLYDIDSTDIIANHAPVFFDISLLGYFTAPFVGATTVILSDAQTIMPASLADVIEKEKISIWYSVPLALIQLVQHGVLENKSLDTVRWVLYAGEQFPVKYLNKLIPLFNQAMFSNIYGPAETNQCTYYNFDRLSEDLYNVPLGQIWGRTKKLIINENEERVYDHSKGELLIHSDTMMERYWNNPELTMKAFYNLKTENESEKYYRTGDLVSIDKHKVMHFHGRKDHQIKTRGYRVELSAVEAFLVEHQEVSEAAVYSVVNEDETVEIEAAVTRSNESTITEAGLRNYLKTKLPHYAVPSKIQIISKFPRTASGKINRKLTHKIAANGGYGR